MPGKWRAAVGGDADDYALDPRSNAGQRCRAPNRTASGAWNSQPSENTPRRTRGVRSSARSSNASFGVDGISTRRRRTPSIGSWSSTGSERSHRPPRSSHRSGSSGCPLRGRRGFVGSDARRRCVHSSANSARRREVGGSGRVRLPDERWLDANTTSPRPTAARKMQFAFPSRPPSKPDHRPAQSNDHTRPRSAGRG